MLSYHFASVPGPSLSDREPLQLSGYTPILQYVDHAYPTDAQKDEKATKLMTLGLVRSSSDRNPCR